ncbi:MAG: putative two-component sensor/response regulator protein [Pseudomonas sp.]|jgi:two-component system sensor histidine kinase EvgS|uniref:transporter substrate-binding domain-containing protein n=1 Tax=Pseudomonas entomophila TaxID=312306 RepID=UPI0015E384D4|nr:transporter substrate-binding domain-containing protein [Pseudomonas entomophila]MBA1193163.1 transporter substrate-binding domain-containing protein [Pseudomonas entomophila]MDF2488257.1 putative two-component sensor/response regulator protein [Pseudomonas sp.]
MRWSVALVCVGWLLTACPTLLAADDVTLLTLLDRGRPVPVKLILDAQQRRWIEERRELRLGTSAPDYPPFDITSGGRDYQGLTADHAAVLGASLGMPIKVLRFADRQAAIQALKNGQIDLLGSANGYEAAFADVSLSVPYATDQPVLVTRENENRPLDMGLSGLRLSMLYHYLPSAEVHAAYPGATLQSHPTPASALNAVAFGQADVFIGDTISTLYQLNQGHLPNLTMANFGKHEAVGFGFALRRDDTVLLTLVNAVLSGLPALTRKDIFERWSTGSDTLMTDRKLQLTPREERWLHEHPVMRVAIDETAAPLTFFDKHDNFRGIAADLLELIRLRTGLRFEVIRATGTEDMVRLLKEGKANVIAAIAHPERHADQLSASRPYLETSYVLISKQGERQPASLDDLAHRRLAIPRDTPLAEKLAQRYPHILQSITDGTPKAIALLKDGQVDAVVASLVDANHALANDAELLMRTTVSEAPAVFSMATPLRCKELAQILDKALLSISPEELGVINSRWRGYSHHDDTQWQAYQRIVLQIVVGTLLLLVLSLIWNTRLRRQIAQRERAERALNDQVAFMRALLDGTPHPMYVRDREGRMQTCNQSYLDTVQASAEQVIGKRLQDSVMSNCAYTRQIQADYLKVLEQAKPLITDRPLRLKDRELTIYHWILPYRDSLGQVQGIICGWIDISDRRKLVQDLSLAKQRADQANRAKSTFLATMSHEIRTPMNAVLGMLELALKHADQGRLEREAIAVAHRSARDLLKLIGDILDFVRIESGHLSLSPEPVAVAELVEAVASMFDGLARQKGLALEVDIAADARCHALLDPMRFKQVLCNLIGNAIKFTDHGQVRISMRRQAADDPAATHLELEVRDSGIGIHEEDLKRLFTAFAQVDPDSDRARAGTGLGLAISQAICQLMGASLTMDSLLGVGTRVRLSVPLQAVEPASAPDPVVRIETPDARLRVLVVDDHPANVLLLGQQLAFLGVPHRSASHGEEGLALWRKNLFDVLVVDCNMPVMNGYQLARRIREEEARTGRPRCTLLGYTANAQPEILQQCLEAGMDDCLFKPIDLQALGRRLAHIAPLPAPALVARIDLTGLDAIDGNDPHERQRLLETLRHCLHQDLLGLMAVDPDTQREALSEVAHKVLGPARLLGADALCAACEAVQRDALTATSLQLRRRRQALARHMRRVERALQGILQAHVGPTPSHTAHGSHASVDGSLGIGNA